MKIEIDLKHDDFELAQMAKDFIQNWETKIDQAHASGALSDDITPYMTARLALQIAASDWMPRGETLRGELENLRHFI